MLFRSVAAGAVFVCAAFVFFFFPAKYRTTGMLAIDTEPAPTADSAEAETGGHSAHEENSTSTDGTAR